MQTAWSLEHHNATTSLASVLPNGNSPFTVPATHAQSTTWATWPDGTAEPLIPATECLDFPELELGNFDSNCNVNVSNPCSTSNSVPLPAFIIPFTASTANAIYNSDSSPALSLVTQGCTAPLAEDHFSLNTEVPVGVACSSSQLHRGPVPCTTSKDEDMQSDGSVSDISSSDSTTITGDSWTDISDTEASGVDSGTATERFTVFKELWECLPNVDPNFQFTEDQVMTEASRYISYLQHEVCKAVGMNQAPHQACPELFQDKQPVPPAATASTSENLLYKRPKNGFIRYAMKNRRAVALEHPKLDNREISRMLGVKWKLLSHEEKKEYEDEFQAEMAERRKISPDWKYGMVKRYQPLVQDNPIPSRLRPRDKLKRKFQLPGKLKRFYKRRKVPTAPRHRSVWVQCDRCTKWRQMPEGTEAHTLPDKWYCEYNVGPYNSCQVAEDTNIPSTEDSNSSASSTESQVAGL